MGSTDHEVLTIRGLSKSFGDHRLLVNVELACDKGEIKALVGPNGAGKTTLFDIVSGLTLADKGDVLLEGRTLVGLQPHEIAALGVARLFQDLRLFENLTVLENVLVALTPSEDEEPMAGLLCGARVAAHERCRRTKALDLLGHVGLLEQAHRFAGELSSGQQKLTALARTFASDSGLLLLDEPSTSLDSDMTERASALIRRAAAAGTAVILIEHDLTFVGRVTDRVALLNLGSILIQGSLTELNRGSLFLDSFLGSQITDSAPGAS